MSIDSTMLSEAFRAMGLREGDSLLIHSSMKSLGYVEGGASTVINSALWVLGDEGTLIVPTLTGKREDSPKYPPIFDVSSTPCWTGIIPETLRKMKGAKRSLHPTHSVAALGHKSSEVTQGHENSISPCDDKSPYYKNSRMKGYIMLIGVDQESNTSIHSCEEIAGVPYHLQREYTTIDITGPVGEKITVRNRLHDWNKPATDFNRLDSLYLEKGIMSVFKLGNSTIRLINSSDMFDFTIDLLVKSPEFLIVQNNIFAYWR